MGGTARTVDRFSDRRVRRFIVVVRNGGNLVGEIDI